VTRSEEDVEIDYLVDQVWSEAGKPIYEAHLPMTEAAVKQVIRRAVETCKKHNDDRYEQRLARAEGYVSRALDEMAELRKVRAETLDQARAHERAAILALEKQLTRRLGESMAVRPTLDQYLEAIRARGRG
jgi:hypothetical protein